MDNETRHQLRHALLTEARELLYEQWNHRLNQEQVRVDKPSLRPPTTKSILKLAETFYEFVTKGGADGRF